MEKDGDRIVKGVTSVLGISIALAVIAGIAVWWFVIH